MHITLEQIDELKKRANCTFEEAKIVLEKNNGDLLESVIELEKRNGIKMEEDKKNSFSAKLKNLIDKGFKTRFIIEKDEEMILNISINMLLIAALLLNGLLLAVLIIALFLGYKIRIKKEKGKEININNCITKAVDSISTKE